MKFSCCRGRRGLLRAGVATALALSAWAFPSMAQTAWPERPVRVIVPYAAGQGADVLMRLVGQELSASLGQPIVVENRPGAGGTLGAGGGATSAPDGAPFLGGPNATNGGGEVL